MKFLLTFLPTSFALSTSTRTEWKWWTLACNLRSKLRRAKESFQNTTRPPPPSTKFPLSRRVGGRGKTYNGKLHFLRHRAYTAWLIIPHFIDVFLGVSLAISALECRLFLNAINFVGGNWVENNVHRYRNHNWQINVNKFCIGAEGDGASVMADVCEITFREKLEKV